MATLTLHKACNGILCSYFKAASVLSDILIEQDHNILQVCFAAKTAGEVYTSTAQVNASTALSSNFT